MLSISLITYTAEEIEQQSKAEKLELKSIKPLKAIWKLQSNLSAKKIYTVLSFQEHHVLNIRKRVNLILLW